MLSSDITNYLDRKEEITKKLNNNSVANNNLNGASVRTTPNRIRDESPAGEKKQRIIIRMAARTPSKTTKDSLEVENKGSTQPQNENGLKKSGINQG